MGFKMIKIIKGAKADVEKTTTVTEEKAIGKSKAEEVKTAEFKDPYVFEFLLDRIYTILKSQNPSLGMALL